MRFARLLLKLGKSALVVAEFHIARLKYVYVSAALALLVALTAVWNGLLAPPALFPEGSIITVKEGSTIQEVADMLAERGVVRSAVLYSALMRIGGASPDAGKYVFQKRVGLFQVAYRTAVGGFGIEPVRIRIVEGTTVREMARQIKEEIPDFDASAFVSQALPTEGYLYPDTYYFYPDLSADEAIVAMFTRFAEARGTIESDLASSPYSEKDVLIMASILEKEGRGLAEKRAIAGVLWHRIEIGMPLQVDAVFSYIKDVPLYSPSFSDLEIDSPYNTYENKGLPPGPIGNPSVTSMLAAATPASTTALFYLTGNDGVTRFAHTFEEHKRNRANFLD